MKICGAGYMDKLHNMSVPPKSLIHYDIKQIDNIVCFDREELLKYFNCNIDNLEESIKHYVESNIQYIDKAPNGYMFALNSVPDSIEIITCKDIDLLINVFSKTVGNIYIPNRNASFDKSKFLNKLYFNKGEVYE